MRWTFALVALQACSGGDLFVALTASTPRAAMVFYGREAGTSAVALDPVPTRVTIEDGKDRADLLVYDSTFEALQIEPTGDRVTTARSGTPVVDTVALPRPAAWFVLEDGELVQQDLATFDAVFAQIRLPRPPCPTLRVSALVDLATYAHATFIAPVSDQALIVGLSPFVAPRPGFTDHPAELRRVTVDGSELLVIPDTLRDVPLPIGAAVAPGDVRVLMRGFTDRAVLSVDSLGQVTRGPGPDPWVGEPVAASGAQLGGEKRLIALERSGALVEHVLDTGEVRPLAQLEPGCPSTPKLNLDSTGRGDVLGTGARASKFDVRADGARITPLQGFDGVLRCAALYARDATGLEVAISFEDGNSVLHRRLTADAEWERFTLDGAKNPYTLALYKGHIILGELVIGLGIVELEPTPRVCPGVAQGVSSFYLQPVGPYLSATGSVNTEGLPNRVLFLEAP